MGSTGLASNLVSVVRILRPHLSLATAVTLDGRKRQLLPIIQLKDAIFFVSVIQNRLRWLGFSTRPESERSHHTFKHEAVGKDLFPLCWSRQCATAGIEEINGDYSPHILFCLNSSPTNHRFSSYLIPYSCISARREVFAHQ